MISINKRYKLIDNNIFSKNTLLCRAYAVCAGDPKFLVNTLIAKKILFCKKLAHF